MSLQFTINFYNDIWLSLALIPEYHYRQYKSDIIEKLAIAIVMPITSEFSIIVLANFTNFNLDYHKLEKLINVSCLKSISLHSLTPKMYILTLIL